MSSTAAEISSFSERTVETVDESEGDLVLQVVEPFLQLVGVRSATAAVVEVVVPLVHSVEVVEVVAAAHSAATATTHPAATAAHPAAAEGRRRRPCPGIVVVGAVIVEEPVEDARTDEPQRGDYPCGRWSSPHR